MDPQAEALKLAEAGRSVIPIHLAEGRVCSCGRPDCDRAGKHPRVAWEAYQQRRATAAEIAAWWRQWPNANVGIVTGRISGLVVLDVDSELGREYAKGQHLPPTPVAATGRGWHYWFAHPGFEVRNFAKRVAGIDLRGDGGYVLAPPSLHPSGRQYEWLIPPEQCDLAPMPEWLLALCQGPAEAPARGDADWIDQLWPGVGEGERNEATARLAGHYLRQGLAEREVVRILSAWNQRNRPPLGERELSAVVRSITHREREGGGRNFDIDRVQKFVADHPVYRLRIFSCDVDVPGDAIYSFQRVQQLVVQVADRVPTMKSPHRDWPIYLNGLMANHLELLDTPPEASESVVLWARISRYLRQAAAEDATALADGRGVYAGQDHLYFHGPAVKTHLESIGQPIKAMQFWTLVREHGGQQADQFVKDASGIRRHVRCWSVPKAEVADASSDLEEEEIT